MLVSKHTITIAKVTLIQRNQVVEKTILPEEI